MLATLVLQLPTEEGYTGGKLVVKHQKHVKEFGLQLVSALGFSYTVFFADCLHQLQKITSGSKLCLVFNLVTRDSSFDAGHKEFISSQVQKAEAALEPWLEEAAGGELNVFSGEGCHPLGAQVHRDEFVVRWVERG